MDGSPLSSPSQQNQREPRWEIVEATMNQHRKLNVLPAENKKMGKFRQVLPQVFATGASNLLFLSLGMLLGFPALLIQALTNENSGDELYFSTDEASWYGAVTYICEPIGAIISGASLQSFGCKKLMVLINIPLFGCWILIYCATSNFVLHVTSAFAGVIVGLMECPGIRYITEISHPSLRGILTSSTTGSVSLGILFTFFLGSLTDWRSVALISAIVPFLCMSILFQVPETPVWLMSKGRPEAALKSLLWLRTATSTDMVKEELGKLEFYAKKKTVKILHGYGREVTISDEMDERSTAKENENDGGVVSGDTINTVQNGRPRVSFQIEHSEKRGFRDKCRDLTRKEMLVPLCKCFGLFGIFCLSGVPPMRPYLVQIFQRLHLPHANWISVWVSLIGILSNIGCMLLIRQLKKKPLLIFSLAGSAMCLLLLAIFVMLSSPTSGDDTSYSHWWIITLFLGLFFFHQGLNAIAFIYLSEILPYRGRGVATGVVVSFFYITVCVAVKLFSTMELHLGLHGVFFLFAIANITGIFFTIFLLPETEGKFLSDIEAEMSSTIQTS